VVGESLVLERVNTSLSVDLFTLVQESQDYLGCWLPWVDQTKQLSDTESFINEAEESAQRNTGVHYAIRYRNQLVGVVGLAEIDAIKKNGAMGFWLGEKWQGSGLMTRACRALLREALLKQNLETIEVRCGRDNAKSRAIPERLGFSVSRNVKDAEVVRNVSIEHIVYSYSKSDLLE
jgi:ribosomal-protein-serine acetyltransferase